MKFKNILKNKRNIVLAIVLVIIIVGTTFKFVKGMNYNSNWKESSSIEIYLGNYKEENDLKLILGETFPGKNVKIQSIDGVSNEILITLDTKQISDDEKNTFIEKINSKYQTNLTIDEMEITSNSQVKLIDIIYPNILLISIVVLLIVAYFIIRYIKIGILKVIEYLFQGLILTEWLYFSILAICRIPVGSWTIPISMLIFIISVIVLIFIFDKEYQKVAPKKNKKRK